jgi:putative oxidoreductase
LPNIGLKLNSDNLMKKALPIIASILLGLSFIMASVIVLFNLVKAPPPPEGSPAAMFFGAMAPTGYLKFVKIFELIGGIIVMIPRLRNIGLLLLGPVIINIIAFHTFVEDPKHLLNPMLIIIIVCALYLLWDARKKFAGLLN